MFDKSTIQEIQTEISAALKQIAQKHNLTMDGTKISYNDATFKLSCQFGDNSATNGTNPIYLKDLQRWGSSYGLSMSMVGKCGLQRVKWNFRVCAVSLLFSEMQA